MIKHIRIATRGSQLALWQAHHVGGLITTKYPNIQVEYKIITTSGDKIQDKPLYEVGGKGLFLKEIEEALLKDEADLAVHSLKDVPFDCPAGLFLSTILPRQDARDVLISKGEQFADLKPGSIVGTSSLRRKIQLQKLRPDLIYQPLRGNVDTRLNKVVQGDYAAIVLAAAGLNRLGWQNKITDYLPIVPSVGQGAIAIEIKETHVQLADLLKPFHCAQTGFCVQAERLFLRQMQGSCSTPVGCHVALGNDSTYQIQVFSAQPDGSAYYIYNDTVIAGAVEAVCFQQGKNLSNVAL